MIIPDEALSVALRSIEDTPLVSHPPQRGAYK